MAAPAGLLRATDQYRRRVEVPSDRIAGFGRQLHALG